MLSMEPRVRERSIRTDAGHRLFLSEYAGVDNDLPVLFLNSLAADHTMWSGVRERLGGPSIAFDARGHGQSDVVDGDCDLDAFADDAIAVLDAAGIERAVLCGLSLGGLTAMHMAGQVPDRVAGLVLANTAVSFPPAQMWRDRAEMARSGSFSQLVQPTLERWLTAQFRDMRPDIADKVRLMIGSTPPEGYAIACSVLETGNTQQALAGFDGPVLSIAGRHDQSTPVARAEEIADIPQQGELVVLEAAHLSAVERTDEFAVALQAFVRQVGRNG